jgi:hypothetical protein
MAKLPPLGVRRRTGGSASSGPGLRRYEDGSYWQGKVRPAIRRALREQQMREYNRLYDEYQRRTQARGRRI